MDKKYIVIGTAIWEVISESDTYYEIHTRNTWARVNKSEVYVRAWSFLLWYDGENIEIKPSNIEIENETEYEEWLSNESKNINLIDKISKNKDYGYMEDFGYNE